jgi:hypothetical protein
VAREGYTFACTLGCLATRSSTPWIVKLLLTAAGQVPEQHASCSNCVCNGCDIAFVLSCVTKVVFVGAFSRIR